MKPIHELRYMLQQRRTASQPAPFTSLPHYPDDNVEVPAPGMPGLVLRARLEYQDYSEPPWDQCEPFATPVWYDRRKHNIVDGELSGHLRMDTRNGVMYYPFAEALVNARKEWDGAGKAKRDDDALAAVRSEYEYFRRWLSEDWCYVGVVVELCAIDEDDEQAELEVLDTSSVWGVESDNYAYHVDLANENAHELLHKHAMAHRFQLSRTLHTEHRV